MVILRESSLLQKARQRVRPVVELCRTPLIAPMGAKRSRLRAAEVLDSGLVKSGLLHDDTSGLPAP